MLWKRLSLSNDSFVQKWEDLETSSLTNYLGDTNIMLYKKNDSQSYVMEFKKRFENFCSKAPLLMSYTTTPNSVQIVDESTDMVFDIPFDFSIPVKSFIYGIKQLLIKNGCYPIIEQEDKITVDLTNEEQVAMAVAGKPVSEIPKQRVISSVNRYLIDKCIIYRDEFIIQDLSSGEMFRYKLLKSCVFFLQKMRNKEKTPLESGTFFFKNSILLNSIEHKTEEQS
jgi:hypothetical protein